MGPLNLATNESLNRRGLLGESGTEFRSLLPQEIDPLFSLKLGLALKDILWLSDHRQRADARSMGHLLDFSGGFELLWGLWALASGRRVYQSTKLLLCTALIVGAYIPHERNSSSE